MFEKIPDFHTIWKMTEQKYKNDTLDEVTFHFIEMPKYLKSGLIQSSKLAQWLDFINYEDERRIQMAIDSNTAIKKANEKLEEITDDERAEWLAWERQKGEYEYNTRLRYDKEKARAEGLAEGRAEGREEGRAEGRVEGEKLAKNTFAKKLLKANFSIEQILELTGLSKDEIEKLK